MFETNSNIIRTIEKIYRNIISLAHPAYERVSHRWYDRKLPASVTQSCSLDLTQAHQCRFSI